MERESRQARNAGSRLQLHPPLTFQALSSRIFFNLPLHSNEG